MTFRIGGVGPRDQLVQMEERQDNYAVSAYWAGETARSEFHAEVAEAFGWVIYAMDQEGT